MRWLLSGLASLALVMSLIAMAAAGSADQPSHNPAARGGDGEMFSADDLFPVLHSRDGSLSIATVGPAAVIGVDERVQILDTTEFPWRAISYLELYDQDGFVAGSCTGTFIGPDTLLTAAHCLYEDGIGFTWDIAVFPGADGPDNPFGAQFAENWWVPDAWVDTGGDPLYDWGVIKMPDSDFGNTLGWFPVVVMTTDTLERADFTPAISGYPGDQVDDTQWFDQEEAFVAVGDYTLDYVIDTAAGQSGAAIFSNNLAQDFGGAIVGVHAYGGDTSNSGSRIDEELLDDVLTGCDEMGCTIEAYIEGGPTITPGPLAWRQGDANCSGGLDVGDIAALIRMAVDGSIPVGCATYQDDVNCLNGTDALDALGVAVYLAEADPLPVNSNCTPIGDQLPG